MEKLIDRSFEYEKLVKGLMSYPFPSSRPRDQLTRVLCGISLEHGESVKHLVQIKNFTSSVSLIRLQYESFVRSLWFYYVATDHKIEKFSSELTAETSQSNSTMPMISEMLKKMNGKVPQNALDKLLEFREYSWKPLSSYVHSGFHATDRFKKGYPSQLLEQSVKTSNQLTGMVGYFLAIQTGNATIADGFHKTFYEFSDCFQIFENN